MTMRETKMKATLAWTVAVAGLALAVGCTKAGKSLIPVVVDASDARLAALASITISVGQAGKTVATTSFAQAASATPVNLGIRVPADVNGTVTVSASGSDSSAKMIAASDTGTTSVTAGQTAACRSPRVLWCW